MQHINIASTKNKKIGTEIINSEEHITKDIKVLVFYDVEKSICH